MVDSLRTHFARVVRARREALDLTQEAVADRCGVSVRHWRVLEAGRAAVSLDVMGKMLAGLDWSWHDLADQLEPAEGAPAGVLLQLERAWAGASAREREVLQGVLRVLARGKR